jgi:hypothetical protein
MTRASGDTGIRSGERDTTDSRCGVSTFDLVSRYHANATACQVARIVIDLPAMGAVSKACSSIFNQADRDDPVQRAAARDAWLVKSSLMLTALPFSDPRLALDDPLTRLKQVSTSVPGIRSSVDDLAGLVRQLASAEFNPKRVRLLELLDGSNASSAPAAILANLCGSPTPGWPASIAARSDFGTSEVELVRLRRQTKNSLYRRLIIPGNPRFAPRGVLFDLLHGGRTSDVIVVAYRSEHVSLPVPKKLPKDSFIPSISRRPQHLLDSAESGADTQVDEWAHESFWSSIQTQHADISSASGMDRSEDATFVLFADGSGAFLPSDGRVVEVSGLFDTGANFDTMEYKLPRTEVRNLEEGNLVMLRLSGSGDYLDDVADSLIQQAGEAGLRTRALQWKHRLLEVIKRNGEGVVAMKMLSLGVRLRSPGYLWIWAGDSVMAPKDRQTFQSLVATIWQLETPGCLEEPEAYANSRWDEMERLKTYHHKAGAAIRAALLTRVRRLVSERRRIDTVESIELPGVEAGRIGLLRVAAVDIKTRKVPVSRLFHLVKVKVT